MASFHAALGNKPPSRRFLITYSWLQKSLNQLTTSKIDFLINLYSDGCTLVAKFPSILNLALQRIGKSLSSPMSDRMESKRILSTNSAMVDQHLRISFSQNVCRKVRKICNKRWPRLNKKSSNWFSRRTSRLYVKWATYPVCIGERIEELRISLAPTYPPYSPWFVTWWSCIPRTQPIGSRLSYLPLHQRMYHVRSLLGLKFEEVPKNPSLTHQRPYHCLTDRVIFFLTCFWPGPPMATPRSHRPDFF